MLSGRVVVTGFEAFGGDAINPTAEAIRSFERDPHLSERMAFVVLPVTFAGAPGLVRAMLRAERACGCLMFGLSRRTTIDVEDSAFNATDGGPATLRLGGADVLHPRAIDVAVVLSALREVGAPCAVSSDPGRYVCNATYYETLATFGGQIPVLFVHVPATTTIGGSVPQETLERWMAAAIDAFVEAAWRSPRNA